MAKSKRRSSKAHRRASEPARYRLHLSSRTLPLTLLAGALLLLACHAGLALYNYRVEPVSWLLRQLFDVDQENNLPTWYSAFLLLLASALLWLTARKKKADGDGWSGQWLVLAVGFLLMSLDEVAGVHESINSVIEMTWAIPGAFMAGVIGLPFVPFLLDLPRRTALGFALAGAIYLGGAVGIELIGNSLHVQNLRDTLQYNLVTLAEEALEMLGVVFFIQVLLRYLRGSAGHIDASVEVS